MIEIRKTITLRETIFSELGVEAARPITRAVGMAVIRNPFAGKFVEENCWPPRFDRRPAKPSPPSHGNRVNRVNCKRRDAKSR